MPYFWLRRLPCGQPSFNFRFRDHEGERFGGDINGDAIAFFDNGDNTTLGGFW